MSQQQSATSNRSPWLVASLTHCVLCCCVSTRLARFRPHPPPRWRPRARGEWRGRARAPPPAPPRPPPGRPGRLVNTRNSRVSLDHPAPSATYIAPGGCRRARRGSALRPQRAGPQPHTLPVSSRDRAWRIVAAHIYVAHLLLSLPPETSSLLHVFLHFSLLSPSPQLPQNISLYSLLYRHTRVPTLYTGHLSTWGRGSCGSTES